MRGEEGTFPGFTAGAADFKIDGCAAKFDVAVIRRELNALHDAAGNFQRGSFVSFLNMAAFLVT